jgi:hypothetical protein
VLFDPLCARIVYSTNFFLIISWMNEEVAMQTKISRLLQAKSHDYLPEVFPIESFR